MFEGRVYYLDHKFIREFLYSFLINYPILEPLQGEFNEVKIQAEIHVEIQGKIERNL
jgi:hypothetical protein